MLENLQAPAPASAYTPPTHPQYLPLVFRPTGPPTIQYTYDALNRLTEARYAAGAVFTYTYDAVGNRLTQQTLTATTTYLYDDANRLASVNGQPYAWDDNGNLLNDGVTTYAYDAANRLVFAANGVVTTTYTYNGFGERVQQAENGISTTYAVDMAGGLTQVLADGTHTYVYGLGRINQQSVTQTHYFLGDALGSVRQLADASGSLQLTRSYDPYGNVLTSVINLYSS